MDLETKKINRQVTFMHAQAFDPQIKTGKNNTWFYNRAPDGYKFILESVQVSTVSSEIQRLGIFAIFDGHEYTHWNIFPGVESKELLFRGETNSYVLNLESNLHGWECKEFTLGMRSHSEANSCKFCVVVWYYLRMMTSDETKMYAVLQPKSEHFRKGGPRTLTEGEETDD